MPERPSQEWLLREREAVIKAMGHWAHPGVSLVENIRDLVFFAEKWASEQDEED